MIFALPGVGRLVWTRVFARDYPLVQGWVLLIAVGFILSNLLVTSSMAGSIPGSDIAEPAPLSGSRPLRRR